MKRVLFICSQNRLRSPTAEQIFSTYPGIEFSSGGLNHDAENPVTAELNGAALNNLPEVTIVIKNSKNNPKLTLQHYGGGLQP